MNIGFYTAASGLTTMQQGIDVVSNNMANVDTNGFKAIRTSFSDLLYTIQKPQNEEAQTGHGVKNERTDVMFEPGQLSMTGRDLDFVAIENGFFAVQDANGDIGYTKNGAFYTTQTGNDWYLVTANGDSVLDYDKKPIKIIKDEDGNINGDKLMENIGVYKFTNPYGLEAKGATAYKETESSGDAVADKKLDKLSGALERSTVDLADQMTKLITLQRGFQLNSKMVQTADEIENIVNNLR